VRDQYFETVTGSWYTHDNAGDIVVPSTDYGG
jgi:hypothetical protein